MTRQAEIEWPTVKDLAKRLAKPGTGPGDVLETEWQIIEQALNTLITHQSWEELITLRLTFRDLFARDTAGGISLLQRLDYQATVAARYTNNKPILAHLLGAKGHNLHRQGYHQASIEAFEESARLYEEVGDTFESLKNHYMTALCHRALGDRSKAEQVLSHVLQQVDQDDPWRGNPLQVMAWLTQDTGRLDETERLLKEVLPLHARTSDPDMLLVGTLTDLAEVIGLQGRHDEAIELFGQSLNILNKHQGQYDRQEGRTRLKMAELLIRRREYEEAMQLLEQADDLIRGYGHYYDLMWRIQLAKSLIYLRRGHLQKSIRKFQLVLRYRQELGLSTMLLLRQLLTRFWAGTGLPR